jgi:hypothetical protein
MAARIPDLVELGALSYMAPNFLLATKEKKVPGKVHKEKKIIKTILIKNFWKSRNLFSKRFLAAGGKG